MTGVEAVSNGVKAFREPVVKSARGTLTVIIALLIVMLAGIAYLVRAYGIQATDPGAPGYQSVLSMLLGAVAGRGAFYYISIGSILAVLTLSANTAFADFPRLCRAIAQNNYLPHSFATRGRRLVYTQGVIVLAVLAGVLIVIFGGVTDRLIPLFAIGAFLAFTLSQAGMVGHWRRVGGRGSRGSMLINGLGAVATGITVIVVLVAKFVEGAWITVLLIPGLLLLMGKVRRHYHSVFVELRTTEPVDFTSIKSPVVIVRIQAWGRNASKALQFALQLSRDVYAVHVDTGEGSIILREEWSRYVEQPATKAGCSPQLIIVPSPYRLILTPIVDYALKAIKEHPGQQVVVVTSELVERHWYHYLLHNQRSSVLKTLLLLRGNQRIIIINVPWYLKE
jgi:hypothetical protein